jgi:hypothetical protein
VHEVLETPDDAAVERSAQRLLGAFLAKLMLGLHCSMHDMAYLLVYLQAKVVQEYPEVADAEEMVHNSLEVLNLTGLCPSDDQVIDVDADDEQHVCGAT